VTDKTDILWTVQDRDGNDIYLTQERWEHIVNPINHPEMIGYEHHLQETIQHGKRKQDSLNPQKYRYTMQFDDLPVDNCHCIVPLQSRRNRRTHT
jgi:hypothetical protein